MSMNELPNPGSAAKLLVCQRSRAPKVVVARTVPNSAVGPALFYLVSRRPPYDRTVRSDPERRMAELGLANGDNLRNSFPLVTGNSPDVIPPTGISQGYIRGPGRSSKPSVSTPVTRLVTPFLLGLSPHPRAIIAI